MASVNPGVKVSDGTPKSRRAIAAWSSPELVSMADLVAGPTVE